MWRGRCHSGHLISLRAGRYLHRWEFPSECASVRLIHDWLIRTAKVIRGRGMNSICLPSTSLLTVHIKQGLLLWRAYHRFHNATDTYPSEPSEWHRTNKYGEHARVTGFRTGSHHDQGNYGAQMAPGAPFEEPQTLDNAFSPVSLESPGLL